MNVGVSALIANQQALTTTGHNIANVNSAAYSRQTIATKALVGQNMGTGYVGKGVQVATVMRNYNELLGKQSNAANAATSRWCRCKTCTPAATAAWAPPSTA